uniref:RNase H type-1 domain-containing protein n=1 Tax=Cannabis sativa TaxID=3483 RepID=A0A803PF51_CANSA
MAAPRRRQHTIGSPWLRSGANYRGPVTGGGESTQAGVSRNIHGEENNQGLIANLHNIGNPQQIIRGDVPHFVEKDPKAKDKSIQGGNDVASEVILSNNALLVVENKRRRTDVAKELDQDVSMPTKESEFCCEAHGLSGGLAFLWKNEDEGSFGFSQNHIDMKVVALDGSWWRLTGFMESPPKPKRANMDPLKTLKGIQPFHGVIGDLNNVLSQEDKKGGRPYPQWLLQGFQGCLDECGLEDLELLGYPFTWERGRGTREWIEVRLDRALVTNSCVLCSLSLFIEFGSFNIAPSPNFSRVESEESLSHSRRFRFENAWLSEPMCYQLVQDCWDTQSHESISGKISKCAEVLARWGKEVTGDFKARIKHCKTTMSILKPKMDAESVKQYDEARNRLFEVLEQRETFWKQRAKQFWLKGGDKNSKYFHKTASSRKQHNTILQLKDDHGTWVDWNNGLANMINAYYTSLFATANTRCRRYKGKDPRLLTCSLSASEGLSSLLYKYERNGWIHGCKVANGAPRISHMLFADDSYLYCKATLQEAQRIQELLHKFESASGQQVNFAKSSIFFSLNTDHPTQMQICNYLHMAVADEGSFYLGLPSTMSRNKTSVLGFLRDKPRLFKARYFPNGNFLNAQLGSNPSFVWRSILESQSLLKHGIRWCVGDGTRIQITGEPWLPHEENPKVTGLMMLEMFLAERRGTEASFKMQNRFGELAITATTVVQLRTKRVDVSPLCSICHIEQETILHALVTCREVSKCWDRVGIGTSVAPGAGFFDWCSAVFCNKPAAVICRVVAVCWAVWGARNNLVWNKKPFIFEDVVAYAFRYLDQWKAAQISSDSSWPILTAADVSEQWTPPNGTSVKINVDAAMFNDGRSFGLGMVARNSDGLLIAGKMKYTAVQVEVVVAEAIGIREVLSWLKENRWPQVYIETDSLCVVQAIHSSTDMISLFGSVIQDCKTMLASLNNVVISFVKRSVNVVAHSFARAARLYPDCTCSLETVPTELLPCLVADVRV